jgi:hypothetical protein
LFPYVSFLVVPKYPQKKNQIMENISLREHISGIKTYGIQNGRDSIEYHPSW